MNTMELFKEANNGVVLKTSQKVSFDDIFLVHISGKKKKKKLSCSCCPHVEQNMASKEGGGGAAYPFLFPSANTWGPGANVL